MSEHINEIFTAIVAGVSAFVTGLVGWFFGRKKQAAETKASELENVEKAIHIWRDTAEKLQEKQDNLERQISELRESNSELKMRVSQVERNCIDPNCLNNLTRRNRPNGHK